VSCHLEGVVVVQKPRRIAECPSPIVSLAFVANLRAMGTELNDIEADGEKEIKEAEETD
jgi:hypothetical protein